MVKLSAANLGSFYIDMGDGKNQPFTRGKVVPRFERDANGTPTDKIAFEDVTRINDPIVNFTPYNQYINGTTGNPFVTYNEFVTFCITNINQIGDSSSIGPIQVTSTPSASELHLGEVAGNTVTVGVSFTRPANTTAYAANDVVGTQTTGVVTFTNAARINAGSGYITKARIITNQAANAANYRLWLYNVAPTAIADNAVNTLLFADAAKLIGHIDFNLPVSSGSGSDAAAVLSGNVRIAFAAAAGTRNIFAVLETLTVFTPASGQQYYVELSFENN